MPILINLHSFLEVPIRDMFSKSAVSLVGESWDTETESFPWGHIKPGHGADATNSTKLPSLQQPLPLNAVVSLLSPLVFLSQIQKALLSNTRIGGFPWLSALKIPGKLCQLASCRVKQPALEVYFLSQTCVSAAPTERMRTSAHFSLGLPIAVGNSKKILFTMVTE